MKIANYENKSFTFFDVKVGECFYFEDNLFMKVSEYDTGDCFEHIVNAVRIENGKMYTIKEESTVYPVDAEVTVSAYIKEEIKNERN